MIAVLQKKQGLKMKWCEIFKTGVHKDSNGNERVWTVDDLKTIKENFENKNPDVPICCGHPKTNSPAYGWVEKLKIAGNSLYAAYKDVQNEFKEAANKGLFKTRSISLTPDLILRHVAFLGGQAPAIKGLEQFCFNDETENEIVIDFQAGSAGLEFGSNINKLDQVDVTEGVYMTEEDLQKQVEAKEAEIKAKEEELNQKQEEIKNLETKIAENEKEKQQKEFSDFCENAIKEGHLLPSQKQSVINIFEACSAYSPFEFSDENGNKTEKTAIDMFKEFVGGLKQMNFEEIATQKNVSNNSNNIDFQDVESIKNAIIEVQAEYKQKGINLQSSEAMDIVRKRGDK